jgi:hypothetical protein
MIGRDGKKKHQYKSSGKKQKIYLEAIQPYRYFNELEVNTAMVQVRKIKKQNGLLHVVNDTTKYEIRNE